MLNSASHVSSCNIKKKKQLYYIFNIQIKSQENTPSSFIMLEWKVKYAVRTLHILANAVGHILYA